MSDEIERKFLLANNDWKRLVSEVSLIDQGYLTDTIYNHFTLNNDGTLRLTINLPGHDIQIVLSVKEFNILEEHLYSNRHKVVRLREKDQSYLFTIKISTDDPSHAHEIEQEISRVDFLQLKSFVNKGIRKIRYVVYYEKKKWEIDEFIDHNFGLVMAEVELAYRGENVAIPSWVGEEVTGDKRYYNSNLSQ